MKTNLLFIFLATVVLWGCRKQEKASTAVSEKSNTQTDVKYVEQPDWVKNAVIYEVNTRQFSKEGTFAKVEEALPRIKELGVDIVWFMPIHEIGEKNRKEGLGSYYSVKDYTSINPEFGTKEDFKRVVDKAHELGMKVIIDWVANHTAWDHEWISSHPEYYTQNEKGEIIDPTNPETGESWGWTDVADLNFDNKDLWKEMNEDMAYWVTDFDIDGFRCDVAGEVPIEFWRFNNPKLNAIKPMFMLAEAHQTELFEVFNMLYSWDLMGLMNEVNEGKKTTKDIATFMKERKKEQLYMYFTANHDENTWNDAPMKYGKNYRNFAILTYAMGGMPLIYNGQEADINHKLEFFTKDEIDWSNMKYTPFFKNLTSFYKKNSALWNGTHYGDSDVFDTPEGTLAFNITNEENGIIIFQNYTDKVQEVLLPEKFSNQTKTSVISMSQVFEKNGHKLKLEPNSTLVFDLY